MPKVEAGFQGALRDVFLFLPYSLPQADDFYQQGNTPNQDADSHSGRGDILDDAYFLVVTRLHKVANSLDGGIDHFRDQHQPAGDQDDAEIEPLAVIETARQHQSRQDNFDDEGRFVQDGVAKSRKGDAQFAYWVETLLSGSEEFISHVPPFRCIYSAIRRQIHPSTRIFTNFSMFKASLRGFFKR